MRPQTNVDSDIYSTDEMTLHQPVRKCTWNCGHYSGKNALAKYWISKFLFI